MGLNGPEGTSILEWGVDTALGFTSVIPILLHLHYDDLCSLLSTLSFNLVLLHCSLLWGVGEPGSLLDHQAYVL